MVSIAYRSVRMVGLLASGSRDETVRLWDAVTGEQKRAFIGHTGVVNSVSFSPDGKNVSKWKLRWYNPPVENISIATSV